MDLMELINKKKQDLSAGKRAKTAKPCPAEGKFRWRILPGWRGAGDTTFFHDFGQHFIKDQSGAVKAVYMCVDKTYGKPCAVCDGLRTAIAHSHDDAMVELLKGANAGQRILVNALNTDGPTPDVPQILELPPSVFNDFLGIIQEWGPEVLDLDGGKDVVIERTGKGMNTKYSVQVAAKSQPVNPAVMKSIANLDEYVAQESDEQQRRALANVSAISGVLAAPTTPRPAALANLSPSAAAEEDFVDDLPDRVVEVEAAATPSAEDVAAVAATVATATAAASSAAASSASTGDAELDDLLASLG